MAKRPRPDSSGSPYNRPREDIDSLVNNFDRRSREFYFTDPQTYRHDPPVLQPALLPRSLVLDSNQNLSWTAPDRTAFPPNRTLSLTKKQTDVNLYRMIDQLDPLHEATPKFFGIHHSHPVWQIAGQPFPDLWDMECSFTEALRAWRTFFHGLSKLYTDHGVVYRDFHFGNVLYDVETKRFMLIDFDDAQRMDEIKFRFQGIQPYPGQAAQSNSPGDRALLGPIKMVLRDLASPDGVLIVGDLSREILEGVDASVYGVSVPLVRAFRFMVAVLDDSYVNRRVVLDDLLTWYSDAMANQPRSLQYSYGRNTAKARAMEEVRRLASRLVRTAWDFVVSGSFDDSDEAYLDRVAFDILFSAHQHDRHFTSLPVYALASIMMRVRPEWSDNPEIALQQRAFVRSMWAAMLSPDPALRPDFVELVSRLDMAAADPSFYWHSSMFWPQPDAVSLAWHLQ